MANPTIKHLGSRIISSNPDNDEKYDVLVSPLDLDTLDGLVLNVDFSSTSSMFVVDNHIQSITDLKGGVVFSAPLDVARPKLSSHNGLSCALFDGFLVNGTYHQRLIASGITMDGYNTGYGDFFCVASPFHGLWQIYYQNSINTVLYGVGGYPSLSVKSSHAGGQFNGSAFLNSSQNGPQINPPILAVNNNNITPLTKAFSVGAVGTKTSTTKYRQCIDDVCGDIKWWGAGANDVTRWFNQSVNAWSSIHIGNSSALNNGAVGSIMQIMYVVDPYMTDSKRIAICRALSGKWRL